MLVCPWCGEEYSELEVRTLDQASDGSGAWCESCDGFMFFDKEKEDTHRMLLLLEDGRNRKEQQVLAGAPRLRKQLSPLRYPGGKSKAISAIFSRLQAEKMHTFVEVFAGGASLGLSLLDAGVIERLVLNDVDPAVYQFWRSVLESPAYLLSRLSAEGPTRTDYEEGRRVLDAVYNGQQVADDLVAWSLLLLNRVNFSGILTARPMGGRDGTQEQMLARWNPGTLSRRIKHINGMADRIQLHRLDCCVFLEALAAWYPNATLFVDPPYYVKGPVLYPTAFAPEDHERLADLLNGLFREFNGPDIILTYDDVPEVRALYPFARVEPLERYYSIAN